jgi:hypothetical protein
MLKGKNLGVFRDHAQASVKDIEELVEKGKELAICPYYGTRAAVRSSEVSGAEASERVEADFSHTTPIHRS